MDELGMLIRQVFDVDDCQSVYFKSDELSIFGLKVTVVLNGADLAFMLSPGPRTMAFHPESKYLTG
jgi:hypothetical protein